MGTVKKANFGHSSCRKFKSSEICASNLLLFKAGSQLANCLTVSFVSLVAEIPFNFSHYRYRFSMPQLEWPTTVSRMWYSFDIARVHFIRLVTTHVNQYSTGYFV